MKFLADVNIPQSVVTYLTKNGHDVLDLKIENLTAKDTDVISIAKKEARIILSLDKDFIALNQYPKYQVATIVIRLTDLKSQNIIWYLEQLIENQKEAILKGSMTIIKDNLAESHPY